jgi:hypothetical protein
LLNQKPRTFRGAERESVQKKKRTKQKKKMQDALFPNLSGVKFEDAVRALLKTPIPKDEKKTKK